MNKLLVICGATATGKTALGLKLAKNLGGEIISADSRQVYKGMDIGTGKDLPDTSIVPSKDSKLGRVYEIAGVKVWGYDLADPKKGFSVSQYVKKVRPIILDIQKRGKLPILVGGTGLYIKAVTKGFDTLNVPRNGRLRKMMVKLDTGELYEKLCSLDAVRGASMNQSDRQNPRRLVRAIEVAQWQINHRYPSTKKNKALLFDVYKIGLLGNQRELKERIIKRSRQMLNEGLQKEIERLLKQGINWKMQAMRTLGYWEWKDYLVKKADKEVCFTNWVNNQLRYVKRQNLYLKKDPEINWYEIGDPKLLQLVEKVVVKWYSEDGYGEKD